MPPVDEQHLGCLPTDGVGSDFQDREIVTGHLSEIFIEDKIPAYFVAECEWRNAGIVFFGKHFGKRRKSAGGRGDYRAAVALGISWILRKVLSGSAADHGEWTAAAICDPRMIWDSSHCAASAIRNINSV